MIDQLPAELRQELVPRHAEPARHYHNWTHVEALLAHAESIAPRLNDPVAVLYAVVFHDAVYDPRAKDNERRSAALLVAANPAIPAESLQLAKRMIEATEGHILPDDLAPAERADCAHFLDMDLGILGADRHRFDIYEDQIRREYAHVSEPDFRKGRAAVLRHFSARDALYFSEWGKVRFETKARSNLARSLAALAG